MSPDLRTIVNHPGDASYLVARASSYEALKVDVHQGVAQIMLNRPEKMNSLNVPMWAELIDAFEAASRDAGEFPHGDHFTDSLEDKGKEHFGNNFGVRHTQQHPHPPSSRRTSLRSQGRGQTFFSR